MIKANKILRMVRRKVKDNNEVQYSDYDVLDALNECIRYIGMDFSMKNSDFLEKIKKYRQDEMNADIAEQNNHIISEAFKGTGVLGYTALGDAVIGKESDISADDIQLLESVDFVRGVDLPEDFVSLVSVIRTRDGYHLSPIPAGESMDKHKWQTFGGYKIFGGKIFCGADFDLAYRSHLKEVKDVDTDEIELPEVFTDTIVKVTCMVLQNNADTDVMTREISRLTDSLIPSRRYSNVKRRMPFIC